MRGKNTKNLVMIADDDLFIRKLIRSALQDLCEIIDIIDGAEVEEAYKKHIPDILFLDVHLPNVSGMDMIHDIVRHDKGAYIIMLSSDSSFENVKSSRLRGARTFLTKPFDKNRVLRLFNECPTITYKD